jgi:endonuclease/exonuclease/phosphatase family metal-dependent hydrolase
MFRCLESGLSFLHVNSHLDHVSERARVGGNRLILRQTEETLANHGNPPTVVTGDFNCRPGSPAYRVFVEAGFLDTFHAFRGTRLSPGDTDKPTGRIDWILIRDDGRRVEVRSHEILRDGDEAAGKYPSDHYPVLTELELSG